MSVKPSKNHSAACELCNRPGKLGAICLQKSSHVLASFRRHWLITTYRIAPQRNSSLLVLCSSQIGF